MSWADKVMKKRQIERQKMALAKQVKDELLKDGELNRRINQYSEEIREDIQDDNTKACLILFYSAVALALNEQHGFGKQRMLKLFSRVDELFGEPDTIDRCENELGIKISID